MWWWWYLDFLLRKPVVSVIPLNGTIVAGKGTLGKQMINMDNTRTAIKSELKANSMYLYGNDKEIGHYF